MKIPEQSRDYDLSGFGVRLLGVPAGWSSAVARWWQPFAVSRLEDPVIEATVRESDLGERLPGDPLTCTLVEEDPGGGHARFGTPEGQARVEASGRARIDLVGTDEALRCYALMNLLLAALAWRVPARGAAIFHASGVIVEGRGFVLVGPAGAGKSTFARCAREGGAGLLSEDLVLVDASGARPQAASLPFRADEREPLGPGRWPIAAILLPARGPRASLRVADRMRARALLAANLPYAGVSRRNRADLERIIERLLGAVPVRTLTFRPDDSFLPLLRALADESR